MTASTFTASRTVQLLLGLLLFAMLGACSSLPVLHPDMGLQSTEPVQVEGARGPLSAQRSKAILDQLKSKNGEATVLDRHLAIEEAIVDSPLVAGNKVQLLQDGAATYASMFEAIGAAKDNVNMETYIIEDDEVGKRFADTLIEKQRQG